MQFSCILIFHFSAFVVAANSFNMPLDLVTEIRLQEHGISIHDYCPIIRLKQIHTTGNRIQQFEIEAIGGEKVDHSENYGMEGGRKRTEKASARSRKY
jgi:hypothetical protein